MKAKVPGVDGRRQAVTVGLSQGLKDELLTSLGTGSQGENCVPGRQACSKHVQSMFLACLKA